jgi:translation initiation factor IF-1
VSGEGAVAGQGPVVGRVVEILPQAKFRVEIGTSEQILAHWASGAERNFVRLRPGDEVELVLSPQDRTRGRIVKVVRTV